MFVVGGLLIAAATLWWVVQVALLKPGERSDASGYGQFVLTAVGLLVVIAEPVTKYLIRRAPFSSDEPADLLALAMRKQWEQAAAERRLLAPAPLPVRW